VARKKAKSKTAVGAFGSVRKKPPSPKLLAKISQEVQSIQQQVNAGLLPAADALCQQLLERYPNSSQAHYEVAMVYYRSGRSQKALEYIEQALLIDPFHIPALLDCGVILANTGRPEEAVIRYQKLLSLQPKNTNALVKLAHALISEGKLDRAEVYLLKAKNLQPGLVDIYIFLGDIAKAKNQIDRAKEHYRQVIRLKPDNGLAHRLLAMLSEHDHNDDDIKLMESTYARSDIDLSSKRMLALGLGKAHDDLKDYEKSFEYFIEGNKYLRVMAGNVSPDYRSNVTHIKSVFNPGYLEQLSSAALDIEGPIFILGMPRSGTSLVEQILASHSKVYGAGEFFALGTLMESLESSHKLYPEVFRDCPASDAAAMVEKFWLQIKAASSGEPYITDKTPHYFQYIGLIATLLPKAKIIHCVRDPRATCVSIFMQGFSEAHYYASDLKGLGEYYGYYLQIMAYWKEQFPGRILDLHYEEVIDQPESTIRNLLAYCDLPFEDNCLTFHKTDRAVLTPSFLQVRKPIYPQAVAGWRRYEKYLTPLLEGLGDAVQ
jgi:tetratricopeptide (TPR) repeat protein